MAFGVCEELTKTLDCEGDPKTTIKMYVGLAKAVIVFTGRKHYGNWFRKKDKRGKYSKEMAGGTKYLLKTFISFLDLFKIPRGQRGNITSHIKPWDFHP